MIYSGKDLARAFRTVRKNTIQIAEEIPEDKYGFSAAEGVRTVGQTLAHVAAATQWPLKAHGQKMTFIDFATFGGFMQEQAQDEAQLTSKAAIVAALQQRGDQFGDWLESLSDETLAEIVGFPAPIDPPQKSRFEMLMSVKEHEMHHRGQLMLVERMLGIVPHLTRNFQAAMERIRSQQASA